MQPRTFSTFDSLDATSVAILATLLSGSADEAELILALEVVSQSTVNRHLHRLHRAGLVRRDPGRIHAPRRRWWISHPEETAALVRSAATLEDVLAREASKERRRVQVLDDRSSRLRSA